MPAGRPPKPARLKFIEGARRTPQNEPQAVRGRPAMPNDLTDVGIAAWREAVDRLDEQGTLTLSDGPLLMLYAHAAEGYHTARDRVLQTDLALVSQRPKGGLDIKRNPFCAELHKYRNAMQSLLIQLAMTPTERAKIGMLRQDSDNNPLAKYIG